MRTIYFHVGMAKTGTTSLQRFFAANDDLLARCCNIYYPKTGRIDLGMHRNLLPFEEKTFNILYNEIKDCRCDNILVSEENISVRQFDGFDYKKIKHIFFDFNIKIIIYIRRMDNYIKSRFITDSEFGKEKSYADFLQRKYTTRDMCLFQSILIDKAESYVGKDNLIVRIYDKKLLKDGNIIADFCNMLNIVPPEQCSIPPHTPYTDANRSLPPQSANYFSEYLLHPDMRKECRDAIMSLVKRAYTFPESDDICEEYRHALEEEIMRIDNRAPGYKKLFDNDALSFSFYESDNRPYELLVCSLLYACLDKIYKLAEEKDILQELKKANEEHTDIMRQLLISKNEQILLLRQLARTRAES